MTLDDQIAEVQEELARLVNQKAEETKVIDERWVMHQVAHLSGEWAQKDPEAAHSQEDDLHQEVLSAIADERCLDPVSCAREALKTKELGFPRWCA